MFLSKSLARTPLIPLALRDYQQDCINACLTQLKEGVKRQAVSLPVGSGKTVIFSNLIKHVPAPANLPFASKTLVLAHRTELLSQAAWQIRRVMPDSKILLEQGAKMPSIEEIQGCDVVVASVPTLGNAASNRIDRFDPKQFKCIIIDEAHHASAATYTRLLEKFGALSDDSHLFVWGCSATLRRHDGRSLDPVFQCITYHKSFLEMIQQKYLCNLRIATVKTTVSLTGIPTRAGDFLSSELSKRVNTPHRNLALVKAWEEKAVRVNNRRHSTLVFAADVQHIDVLVALFKEHGHDARGVHGKTSKTARSETLAAFRRGEFPVLVNCGILTEGVDISRIDCIILARPTRSGVLLQQMIGRGLRQYLDPETGRSKENCLIIDFADTCADTDFGIHSTMPTLMGLRPDFHIPEDQDIAEMLEKITSLSKTSPWIADEARTLEEVQQMAQEKESSKAMQECQLTLSFSEFNLSDVFEVDNIASDNLPLHAVSPLAWVRVGQYDCVLNLRSKESVLVQRNKAGQFSAVLRTKQSRKNVHWISESLILHHDSLSSTIHAVDHWATVKYPFLARNVLQRSSKWRRRDASDAQMAFLRSKGLIKGEKRCTSGMAADIITKFIYGAKGRAKRAGVEKRKEEKKAKLLAGSVI